MKKIVMVTVMVVGLAVMSACSSKPTTSPTTPPTDISLPWDCSEAEMDKRLEQAKTLFNALDESATYRAALKQNSELTDRDRRIATRAVELYEKAKACVAEYKQHADETMDRYLDLLDADRVQKP
jgi:hypothetical protein